MLYINLVTEFNALPYATNCILLIGVLLVNYNVMFLFIYFTIS